MATGAYDANGIWQYGESDPIALFSDLLNLGQESTSDAFTDDRSRIAFLEQSVEQASTFVASSQAARDSYWGIPANATEQLALQNKGARTVRTDLGITQQYFGLYNQSTNIGGRTTAGWYPINKSIGLTPMRPTTVTGTGVGVSATVSAIGTVAYDTATSITLNNVFTNDYKNYKIVIEGITSADTTIRMRLTSGGTEDSTNNYYWAGMFRDAANTTFTALAGTLQPAFYLGESGYISKYSANIELQSPKLAVYTKGQYAQIGGLPGTNTAASAGISHQVASSFDGIKIYPLSGSAYGTVTVYGYNY